MVGSNASNRMERGPGAAVSLLVLVISAPVIGGTQAQEQQFPNIGTIDYYGLRKVSKADVERTLQIKVGDPIPDSPAGPEKRLAAIPGVARAKLNVVCCNSEKKAILYVGIEEAGAPAAHYRSAPSGKISLPSDVVKAGGDFDAVFMTAVEKGDIGEDDSKGYALMNNPAVRAVQEKFAGFAEHDLKVLRAVVRESGNEVQRALAAEIIPFSADKSMVAAELEFAMSDPDSNVRNNAMRGLWVLAKYAQAHPDLHIKISAHPFVRLLNSLVWTDRNKSSAALAALTVKRDPALLADLREHAMPSLVEMCRWQDPGHSAFSCQILGRIAGLPEAVITNYFAQGGKEKIINAAVGRGQTKSK